MCMYVLARNMDIGFPLITGPPASARCKARFNGSLTRASMPLGKARGMINAIHMFPRASTSQRRLQPNHWFFFWVWAPLFCSSLNSAKLQIPKTSLQETKETLSHPCVKKKNGIGLVRQQKATTSDPTIGDLQTRARSCWLRALDSGRHGICDVVLSRYVRCLSA